jgi:DnaJ-class molecular chaperone
MICESSYLEDYFRGLDHIEIVSIEDHSITCWSCNGLGKLAFHDGRTVTPNKTCSVCNGTGNIK